jgi:hypothetical protein
MGCDWRRFIKANSKRIGSISRRASAVSYARAGDFLQFFFAHHVSHASWTPSTLDLGLSRRLPTGLRPLQAKAITI